jgi:hypothetical protein
MAIPDGDIPITMDRDTAIIGLTITGRIIGEASIATIGEL